MIPSTKREGCLRSEVETRVRQSTYGRIRNLRVEEVEGLYRVLGQVPSHHTKQLALHGALELIGADRFADGITVGMSARSAD
ncbi:MAG: hypothetical protein SFX72_09410 [Isosphaeraceae bacterium]|nr:hypothetical protein [Isosphaeraceae bacterium]